MKNKYMKLLATLLTIFFVANIHAQQDLMVSQQIFSRMNINPAGTGNNNRFNAFLIGRLQWAGVDNSPKTGLLNFSYYNDPLHSSFGLTVNMDKIGVGNSQSNIQAVYAYHIDLNENYILSMGLSGGINIGSFDPQENILRDQEPSASKFVKDKTTEVSPDFNFGVELTSKRWMVGASLTHMLHTEPTTFKKGRHFYIYARTLFELSEMLDIAPMISYVHQHQINNGEIGAMLFINKTFWGGLTWKPDFGNFSKMSMMSATVGIDTKRFSVGYAYSFNIGEYNNLPSNTHEILLRFHF
ncbi:MAG: PorP/SprF family type IX secretion system membrane protein [Bacteroidales bacterium]|nr:PorP/SprF family type IX secretion system membrane protein [Candidatus Scybalocola fimicaballi]